MLTEMHPVCIQAACMAFIVIFILSKIRKMENDQQQLVTIDFRSQEDIINSIASNKMKLRDYHNGLIL